VNQDDQAREQMIDQATEDLVKCHKNHQAIMQAKLYKLISGRSPEQVEMMEVEQGLSA